MSALPALGDASTATGRVTRAGGEPVAGVTADLFTAGADGDREGYLSSTTTGSDGRFELNLPSSGCYVIVLIASEGGRFTDGGRYRETRMCAGPGSRIDGLDAVVAPDPTAVEAGPTALTGRTLSSTGEPVSGLTIDLFTAAGDGSRGSYLRATTTSTDGSYRFDVARACFVVVAIAPSTATFAGAGRYHEEHVCPGDNGRLAASEARLAPIEPALTPTEQEIHRLTNALRADPAGPLARRKPMPACVDEGFYEIELDPASGHPRPVPALVVSEAVSVELARAWAVDMQRRGDFAHRPSESQQRVYARLGIEISAWGENIAWFSGFDPTETARIHFEGWRESDSGHYCSLVTGRFTHVGVGVHSFGERNGAAESWAVQNFYSP